MNKILVIGERMKDLWREKSIFRQRKLFFCEEEQLCILFHPPTDCTPRQEFSARIDDAINGAPSTVIGQSFFTSQLKAAFTLFPTLPSFVSSRRLLTRRLGLAWGEASQNRAPPLSLWARLPLRDEVSLSFRSSFSSTEEVCLSDNEKLLNARACLTASSQPRKMTGRSPLLTPATMRFGIPIFPKNILIAKTFQRKNTLLNLTDTLLTLSMFMSSILVMK